MCVGRFEQPIIFYHCYVRETLMNIRDVQRWDMMPYGNVLLDIDQLNVEEILAVWRQEYNPRKKHISQHMSRAKR